MFGLKQTQLKRRLMFLSACVISIILCSCSNPPEIDRCLVDASQNGLICLRGNSDETYVLPLQEADGHYCVSQDDYLATKAYIKRALDNL